VFLESARLLALGVAVYCLGGWFGNTLTTQKSMIGLEASVLASLVWLWFARGEVRQLESPELVLKEY